MHEWGYHLRSMVNERREVVTRDCSSVAQYQREQGLRSVTFGCVLFRSDGHILDTLAWANPEHLAKLNEGVKAWSRWRKARPGYA